MFLFDPFYVVVMIPALILSLIASTLTKRTFAKYSRRRATSGMTGAQAATYMLASNQINDVRVERVRGFLSDHYDPSRRVLRLSPQVYDAPSLSAIGVACHEAGHALQHARGYTPLHLRTALVPLANIGSQLSYGILFLGLILSVTPLVKIGIVLFSLTVLFSIVTLPVEWDASARAKRAMVACGIVSPGEEAMAGEVLNAAFLTYVAAAVSSVMTLLYYLLRSGLLGGSDD